MPARFQRILQQADGLVFLRCGLAHRLVDAPPLTVLLLLKCRTALSLSMVSKRLFAKALSRICLLWLSHNGFFKID